MRDLTQLEVFVRVGETGSFTEAADALGVSKSYASRQISALEDRLGAQLLHRTTRKVTLTDVGAVFHERCAQILAELEHAEAAVTSLHESPRGELRLSVPMSFGLVHIAPAVAEFAARHADLAVNISFSDRRADLLDEGFDLAVRIGVLDDSSLIGRKLATTSEMVCASQAYLDAHPAIEGPEDLRRHDCLLYAYQSTGQNWRLVGPAGEVTVPVRGRFVANNGEALLEAARHGLGVAFAPDFMVADDLRRGTLRRVLPAWQRQAAVWALYPHNRHLSAKVRLFVDFLVERMAHPPWAGCDEAG